MKFRTAYSPRERFKSSSGSRLRKKYIKSYDKDGAYRLIEDGFEDVYDSIQKAANGVTLDALIRRAKAGDDSAIREPIDSYVDLSHVPKDLLEAHQMLIDAKDRYYSLPAELRSKFGNSFDEFLKASADGSAVKALLQPNKKADDVQPLSSDEITKLRQQIGGTSNA